MDSVFITGGSGCVGHYVIDKLHKDYQLYLLVRNPEKLLFDPNEYNNIRIIHDDLDNISHYSGLLGEVNYCIHIATSWGGEDTERINVHRVHQLFNLLGETNLKRIIYFSTASILGRDMKLLPEAELYGTEYIRSKSKCFRTLPECRHYDKISTVFPTLVFGGDNNHPYSYLTDALPQLKRYSWLIGRINLDIAFHFIHAEDIATIVKYLIESPKVDKKYVLGNKEIDFGEFSKRTAAYFGHKINWQLKISAEGLYKFGKLLQFDISEWDRFCAEYKNFTYPVINCPMIGLPSRYSTVEAVLSDWKLVSNSCS